MFSQNVHGSPSPGGLWRRGCAGEHAGTLAGPSGRTPCIVPDRGLGRASRGERLTWTCPRRATRRRTAAFTSPTTSWETVLSTSCGSCPTGILDYRIWRRRSTTSGRYWMPGTPRSTVHRQRGEPRSSRRRTRSARVRSATWTRERVPRAPTTTLGPRGGQGGARARRDPCHLGTDAPLEPDRHR